MSFFVLDYGGSGVKRMKFNEVSGEDWESLKPYLDTCLLPVTGLTGSEPPAEATFKLEHLRDALELLEFPFKGRVVTYPACHYGEGAHLYSVLNEICRKLKEEAGFKYVIAVTSQCELIPEQLTEADLVLGASPDELEDRGAGLKERFAERVQQLWHSPETGSYGV
jgi:23S rRNA (pseudouridine1915-N3)-methyltransferase